jgi:hypothetical protein
MKNKAITTLLIGSLSLSPLVGCDSLPGDKETQGAVIGGVGGALGGALVGGEDNRLLGALIGGALGAGGGWLIGSQLEKSDDKDDAVAADRRGRNNPVSASEARDARTADINGDGYITMDEVVAMEKADLSDSEMIERLERTGQFFELTRQQEEYLRDQGVSDRVIREMRSLNSDVRERAYSRYNDRSRD